MAIAATSPIGRSVQLHWYSTDFGSFCFIFGLDDKQLFYSWSLQAYKVIMNDFIEDDHDHGISVTICYLIQCFI